MWRLLEYIVLAAIVLLAVTEFFYPLIAGKPFFGSFRKRGAQKSVDASPLNEKVRKAKEKVEEVKNVQDEVDQNYKSAEELKEESDNLLKRPRDPDPFS